MACKKTFYLIMAKELHINGKKMPSPFEQDTRKEPEGCWSEKTRLERVLICVTFVLVIIAIVLLIFIAIKPTNNKSPVCNSTVCLTAAAQVADYINPKINPCEDFYNFACGNFLKNAFGDEKLSLVEQLQAQAKRELLGGYIEDITDQDHKMVRAAKKLFRACMNTTEIEMDRLKTIKEVIRIIGGWPVLEGQKWNAKNFDWLRVSYKLRKLGYHYSIFLELYREEDPDDRSKYIFKVRMPDVWDYSSNNFDVVQLMSETAKLFGANDEKVVLNEMTEAYQLLMRLQKEVHNQYNQGVDKKYTLEAYQAESPSIYWIQFIGNIAGSQNVSKSDVAIFPPAKSLNSWLSLLSSTPKRVQANYMIWKVIESIFSYLPEDIRNLDTRQRRRRAARDEFCLLTMQEMFFPSPIDVMCDRKFLPKDKMEQVDQLVVNIKTELVTSLQGIKWMDLKDKEKIVQKASAMRFVIGQPKNYFDDTILDDLDVDMVETRNQTLLNLFAQANRNRETTFFKAIEISPQENVYDKHYYKTGAGLPIYGEEDNVFYIPAISLQGLLYNQNRPNYLNYGALGTQLGQIIGGVLIKYLETSNRSKELANKTVEAARQKIKCMKEELEVYGLNLRNIDINFLIQQSIGEQLAYTAYQKWVKNNNTELKLIGSDYTPNQLFWISAATPLCQPLNDYGLAGKLFMDKNLFSTMVSGTVRNNPKFAEDFQCVAGSKMNPPTRCEFV